MPETVDVHALAGAYVLDAVDDLERAAFDRHLRDCATCAIEVAELSETSTWLSHPLAVAPPAGLRERVMATVARTPQERPRGTAQVRPVGSHRPVTTPAPGRWRRWTVSAVAASVLAAGAGVGTWAVTEQGIRDQRDQNARIDAVLSASDAKLVQADVAGGRISLIVSPARDAAVAVLSGLRSPGKNMAYQLWMVPADGAKNVGLMPADTGTGRQYISGLHGATTFAVSREKAAGAKTPTDQVGELRF